MVSVCTTSSHSTLDPFKSVDVVLCVGAPDCVTVIQHGSDEKKMCSSFCRFIADLQVSSQEASSLTRERERERDRETESIKNHITKQRPFLKAVSASSAAKIKNSCARACVCMCVPARVCVLMDQMFKMLFLKETNVLFCKNGIKELIKVLF